MTHWNVECVIVRLHRLRLSDGIWHHGKVKINYSTGVTIKSFIDFFFYFVSIHWLDTLKLSIWSRAKHAEKSSKPNGHWRRMSLDSIDKTFAGEEKSSLIKENTLHLIRPSIFTIYSLFLFYSDINFFFLFFGFFS